MNVIPVSSSLKVKASQKLDEQIKDDLSVEDPEEGKTQAMWQELKKDNEE